MAFAYKFESAEILGAPMTFLDLGIGETVLLGHSYLWDAEMWRPQIETLARHYRVIVPNLWGHGGSGPLPADTRDLRDIARHHLGLMDRLGIERFAVLGLSIGGMWGAELAMLAPERVAALALLDTYLGPEPQLSRDKYFALMDAIAGAKRIPETMLDVIVPLFFAPATASKTPALPAAFRVKLQNWDPARLMDSVLPIGRMLFARRDARDDLRSLPMPKLVLTGSEDIPRPVHEGQQMAAILECPFVEIRDAGHISTLEAPEPVTDHLVRFLADALGGNQMARRSAG
ncbi:alpha/beta fold hydrolase [Dongia sedimenti]|uniref:Alpha/beta fold hydrolase n=1 Tax=Dongia sedimenti TaxID=3064282 RepID=A0ABU0YS93_9PROT|nr:alpha/beta fold hydrolase [Rhodospirillaceae bacterium R-7]